MAGQSVTYMANLTDTQKSMFLNPKTSFALVQAGDIDGINYVAGSEGRVKTISEYADTGKVKLLNVTTFKYEDPAYPSSVTDIEVV